MNETGRLISPARAPRFAPLMRLLAAGLFAGIVATAAAAGAASHSDYTPWPLTAGRVAATVALAMFMVQFALSARVGWLDRAFGLDRLYRIHAKVGTAAAVLAASHPLLVYSSGLHRIDTKAATLSLYWPELLGAAVLVTVWVVVVTAVRRVFLGLSYQAWRWIHRLTFVVVAGALVHAFKIGGDLQQRAWTWWAWVAAACLYAAGFVYVKLVRPFLGARCTVVSAERVTHNTVNVVMKPHRRFRYLPGQFVFVRFRGEAVAGEEHPFTLSSSPSRPDALSLTIKQSGDFTGTVDRLRPQDGARLTGPFGRFSHLLLARRGEPLVMIAGGIGITPMLSMLRYMAATDDSRRVTLVWSNRTEADIVFREEIDELQRRMSDLAVHHVLSRQPDRHGQTHRLDRAMLERLLAEEDLSGHAFICGPAGMMRSVRRALRRLGLPRRRIHAEQFALS